MSFRLSGPAAAAETSPHTRTSFAAPAEIVTLDPVCGMTVEPAHARHLAEHDGLIYAFCSIGCRARFVREPAAFLAPAADLDAFELALVITDYEGGLPPGDAVPVPCDTGEGGTLPEGEVPCYTPGPATPRP